MSELLTPEEIAAYTSRSVSAETLKRIGEKVGASHECAAQLIAARNLPGTAATLYAPRLTNSEREGYVQNTLGDAERERVETVLMLNPQERAEIDDLQAFADSLRHERMTTPLPGLEAVTPVAAPLRPASPIRSGVAWGLPFVGAMVAAGIVWAGFVTPLHQEVAHLRKSASVVPVAVASPLPDVRLVAALRTAEARRRIAETKILAANRAKAQAELALKAQMAREKQSASALIATTQAAQANQKALQQQLASLEARLAETRSVTPTVSPSPVPLEIATDKRWVLATRGETPVYPVATAVPTLTPMLRWRPVAGAARYRVRVRDITQKSDAVNMVVAATDTAAYSLVEPLTPGAAYTWSVTALTETGGELAPEVTARFTVPTRATLALLAESLLSAGAITDGKEALQSVITSGTADDAESKAARSLLERVSKP